MKKLLVMLSILLLAFGCSSNSELNNLNLQETITDLDNKYTNMSDLSADELSLVYGLDVSLCDEYVVKASSLANGDFYAILKVNKDNENIIKNQMDNLFNVLENQSNLYSPQAVKLIKNRLSTSIGDYYIYLIGQDTNELYDLVKKHIY